MGRPYLTKSEEELMGFLWSYGKPLSVPEMLDICTEHSWSDHYLRVMLKSLERKKMVAVADLDHRGTQYARRFQCTVTQEEYFLQQAKSRGISVNDLVHTEAVAMVRSGDREGVARLMSQLKEIYDEYGKDGGDL